MSDDRDMLAYLLGQYERAVDIHEAVRMDTRADRETHARVIKALRAAAEPVRRHLAQADA